VHQQQRMETPDARTCLRAGAPAQPGPARAVACQKKGEAAVGVQMFHMRQRWGAAVCGVAGANAGPPWYLGDVLSTDN
jgi:hypothetical protein